MMKFFQWNQEQQVEHLVEYLRSELEVTRDERSNSLIYRLSELGRSNAVGREAVLATHLKERSETDRLKHRLLSETDESFNVLSEDHQVASATNEDEAYKKQASGLLNTSPWLYPKAYFSWETLLPSDEEIDALKAVKNSVNQSTFYKVLLDHAIRLEAEIKKSEPNYFKIKDIITEMRATKWQSHSIMRDTLGHEDKIMFEVGDYFGKNVFMNFVLGLMRTFGSVVAFILGCVAIVPAYYDDSPYFGTSQFLLDCVSLFVEGGMQLISSILFPISMLYAQYTTNSCNIIKGDLARSLDAIETYCDKQTVGLTRPESSNVELDVIPDDERVEYL